MKKLMVILLSIIIAISFCACSNPHPVDDETEGGSVVNPVSDATVEDVYEFLCNEKVNLEGIEINSVCKINADYEILSIDLTKDNEEYNVRFAKLNQDLYQNYGDDISGVYLNGKINSSIFDAADEGEAPTMTVESDSEYSKAYGEWKGFLYSVSSNKMKNDDMYNATNEILKAFLDGVVLYY